VDHAPTALRQAQAIVEEQQERALAHEGTAAGTLVALAVEAREPALLLSAAGALDAGAGVRDRCQAQVATPDSVLVPRRNRGLQGRN
jgi:hypothetical protein